MMKENMPKRIPILKEWSAINPIAIAIRIPNPTEDISTIYDDDSWFENSSSCSYLFQ